jgi:hypothetical protein
MKKSERAFEEYRNRIKNPRSTPLKITWGIKEEAPNVCREVNITLIVSTAFEMSLERHGRMFDPNRDDLMESYKKIWLTHWEDATALSEYEIEILGVAGITVL